MSQIGKIQILAFLPYLFPQTAWPAGPASPTNFAACNESAEVQCVNLKDPLVTHFGGAADMIQRMSFMREVRKVEDDQFKAEHAKLDAKIACLKGTAGCTKQEKEEVAAMKAHLKSSYPDFRKAVGLFHAPITPKVAKMELARRNEKMEPEPLFIRGGGVSSLFSGMPGHTLSEKEMLESDALFYKNFQLITESYDPKGDKNLTEILDRLERIDPFKATVSQANHKEAYLDRNFKEMKSFYQKRYVDLIAQQRILAFLNEDPNGPNGDKAMIKGLERMKENLEEFRKSTVPKDSDFLGNLEGMILNKDSVEKVLNRISKESPQNLRDMCIYADVTYSLALRDKKHWELVKAWGPWALTASCGVMATVSMPTLWPWCLRAGMGFWGMGVAAETFDLPKRGRSNFIKVEVDGKTLALDELYAAQNRNAFDLTVFVLSAGSIAGLIPNVTYIDTSKAIRELLKVTPGMKKSEVVAGVTEAILASLVNSSLNRGINGQVKALITENGKITLSLDDYSDYETFLTSQKKPPTEKAKTVTVDFSAEIAAELCKVRKEDCK